MRHSRRVVGVRVSDLLIEDMMREGWKCQFTESIGGLPQDAKCIQIYNDLPGGDVVFMFEHPSFAEVEFGATPPFEKISFRKYSYPEVDALLEKKKREDLFPMGQMA